MFVIDTLASSSALQNVQCIFDTTIVNTNTIYNFTNLGLSIFAVLCGKNRGVFVTNDSSSSNNGTYSCLTLPPSFSEYVQNTNIPMITSNDIDQQFKAGNITGDETIQLLEMLNTAVFTSSGYITNAYDPYSCNLNGLSTYSNCPYSYGGSDYAIEFHVTKIVDHIVSHSSHDDDHDHHYHHHDTDHHNHHDGHRDLKKKKKNDHDHDTDSDHEVITTHEVITLPKLRGVTLLGTVVPNDWAGNNNNDGYLSYDINDFQDISKLGLNTIVIPVPTDTKFWKPPSDHDHDHHHDDHHHHNNDDHFDNDDDDDGNVSHTHTHTHTHTYDDGYRHRQRRSLLGHPKEPKGAGSKKEPKSKKEKAYKEKKEGSKKKDKKQEPKGKGFGKGHHIVEEPLPPEPLITETIEPTPSLPDTIEPSPSPTLTVVTSTPVILEDVPSSPAPLVTPTTISPTIDMMVLPPIPPPSPKKHNVEYLFDIIMMAQETNLYVILQLEPIEEDFNDVLEHILGFVTFHFPETVIGIQLPTVSNDALSVDYSGIISHARIHAKHLPLFIPVNIGQLVHLKVVHDNDTHLYSALSMEHTTSIGDVASSSSLDDRMKLYYHENVACTQRSPIDYVGCYKNMPAIISSGFDLAIDNCAFQNSATIPFTDYGQCDRWDETIASPWWGRHRLSFAERQLASFEQGIGWIFAAWKVHDDDMYTTFHNVIHTPAQLHSFKAVSTAGLFPDLVNYKTGINDMGLPACLNPPLDDFILGDATLAPVPAPPPDCGNGWWNFTIDACSYWVPPPPPPPCPVCEVCDGGSSSNATENTASTNVTDEGSDNSTDTDTDTVDSIDHSNETRLFHHIFHHHHSTPSENELLEMNLSLGEGIGSSRDVDVYGTHHVGLAFLLGIVCTFAFIAFVTQVRKNQQRYQQYQVIPN